MAESTSTKFGYLALALMLALAAGCKSRSWRQSKDLIAKADLMRHTQAPQTSEAQSKKQFQPQVSLVGYALPQTSSEKSETSTDKPEASARKTATSAENSGALAETQTLPSEIPSEYSLDALEQLALANNPTLGKLHAKVDALQGKWVQVGLRPNTHIGFSGQQLFTHGTEEQIGLYVGQTIVRAPKLDWNQQIVCHEIEQAQHFLCAQQLRVLTDTRLGFYEVLINQRRVKILQELNTIAEQSLSSVKALHKAGESSRVDILRATVEQQAIQVELQNAQNNLVASWSRLVAVLGMPSLPQATLVGDVEMSPLDVDQEQLLQRMLEESPELHAAQADQERARAAWHRASVEALPDIDVQSIVQYDNPYQGTNANLQVTFPIPWRDWNQGGIQQARSEWFAAQQTVVGVELSIRQRLATAWQAYINARQKVSNYSGNVGVIENSKQTLELIAKAYKAGELAYLDLLTAQRTFAQTNLLYLDALGLLWASRIELDGLLLKGSL